MKKLLSLPPNLVSLFHNLTGHNPKEWFCSHDPIDHKLGSGGGSTYLLEECYKKTASKKDFDNWLKEDKRIILHAGGQSRRLPAYAPSGKVLTPIPVFRFERGQKFSQDLLSLQMPLYEQIMSNAPENIHTMITCGDVYIRLTQALQKIPEADVICYGLWLGAEIAKDHGVFVSKKSSPSTLEYMLQKPSIKTLGALLKTHFYLTDIGIWLLSDKAVKLLRERSYENGAIKEYDLYKEFGCSLGNFPQLKDDELSNLKVVVLPLPGAEFYHFGTTHEMISSTLAIQNLVNDQRQILHHSLKPHPSIFRQNSITSIEITEENQNLWIENSYLGKSWTLTSDNVVTGVPENSWTIKLEKGWCVDIVPIDEKDYVLRPYGYRDKFRGNCQDEDVTYLGVPFKQWLSQRGLEISDIKNNEDLQQACLFPVSSSLEDLEKMLSWMLTEKESLKGKLLWQGAKKLSADDISLLANLKRLVHQREKFRAKNWAAIAENYEHSVFYQVDLEDAAREFSLFNIKAPSPIKDNSSILTLMSDSMFRSELSKNLSKDYFQDENKAFSLLQEGLIKGNKLEKLIPKKSIYQDQILWARSPVRIDLAGGWTDTPPYCLMEGGSVVNIAIELNGQPPLQAYIKPCKDYHIVLRSIDLGAIEIVKTFEELSGFNKVGSPFSIPKAALALCGFMPEYCGIVYTTLESQLRDFGSGIEITLLSAIPKGSGLGTSSLLAATVLGALNDFCGLTWDKMEISRRTLCLEQLLTTGGGWQDQLGGLLSGVKLLKTSKGFDQTPTIRWLPTDLFLQPEYAACHLLYYTGITRTAKNILSDIVRRMFLNQNFQIGLLREMKSHAMDVYEAIQREDFDKMGHLVRKTYEQNQKIDIATAPKAISSLTEKIDDLCLGYKLAGAGGGGYLYIIAKDPDASAHIKRILNQNRPNENARFVDMSLSDKGLQVSRS